MLLLLVSCSEHTLSPGRADGVASLTETCNGIDDDGDGFVDEGFRDADANGIADCAVCVLEPASAVTTSIDATCLGVDPPAEDPWDLEVVRRVYEEYENIDSGWTRAYLNGSFVLVPREPGEPATLFSGVSGGTTTRVDRLVSADPMVGDPSVVWQAGSQDRASSCCSMLVARLDPSAESLVTSLMRYEDPYGWEYRAGPHVLDLDGTIRWGRSVDNAFDSAPRVGHIRGTTTADFVYQGRLWSVDGEAVPLEGATNGIVDVGDADLDGVVEIHDAGNVYAPSGEPIRIRAASMGEEIGTHRVATILVQADEDPYAETLVSGPFLALFDDDGAQLWRDELGDDRFSGAWPAVADFDGDGHPEVALAGPGWVKLFELDGTMRWEVTQRRGEYGAALTGWDVDGDGAAEVLYLGVAGWFAILDGLTGEEHVGLYTDRTYMRAWAALPVPIDLDRDGHGEIFLPVAAWDEDDVGDEAASWTVVGPRSGPGWAPAGPHWPGVGFQVTDIDEDGTVAGSEVHPWSDWGVWNARPAADRGGSNLVPVAGAVCADACTEVGTLRLAARVENRGRRTASDVRLSLAAIDSDGQRTLATMNVSATLPAGVGSEEVVFAVPAAQVLGAELRLVADPDGEVVECNERDDVVEVTNPCR